MEYTTLTQRVKETLKSYIMGDRLRVAIVNTDNGIMLKIALIDWGGFEVAYFTKTRYLAVHRTICSKDLARLCVELRCYYGDETDLTSTYTKGVFADYGLFDVSKVWEELGYDPTEKVSFSEIRNLIAEWE
jgi:hypothetical protein